MSLRSTNTCGPLTTDLYRHAGGFPSLPLMVHYCTPCGYSGPIGDFDPEEVAAGRAVITYLIGELRRRTGDPDKAKAWFARMPDAVGGNAKQDWLIDLAIQPSINPKEMVDEKRGT